MDGQMDSRPPSPGHGQSRQAQRIEIGAAGDVARGPRQWSVATPSTASSPLSPAPPAPTSQTPQARRPSHPTVSPLPQYANSPQPATVRRTSSAMSLGRRGTPPPKLARKSSRQSISGPQEEVEKRPTPKRSISSLIANLREAQSTMEPIQEPVPLTAAGVAIEHFARELRTHSEPDASAETVVILHDACYGHRYSRLKSAKNALSMIVERPERIHASVLGASAAYVRLGERHAGGRQAPHPERKEAAPPPFKIRRTARSLDITSTYVTNVHGTAWMDELRKLCNSAGERLATGAKELSRSSTPTDSDKRKLHEGDLYLAPGSLNAFQGALGGVADAVDAVFQPASQTKRAFVAIRPPGHHCSADYPSGFCWLNNVHVGIEYAAQTYGLTHATILDFDLHHGDGSQAITWDRNSKNNQKRLNAKPNSKLKLSPDIGYYSLHDINSYPCEMGDDEKVQAASLCVENAHGQSIWNVHLQSWKAEDEFWQLYESRYRILLDKARMFLRHHTARLRAEDKAQPKAAVFISAGFDASEWEGAGMQRHKVNVPTEFYARFTRDVVQLAQEEGTGCDGRVISVMEGGYSDRALCSGVLSHLSGLCATPVEAVKQASNGVALDEIMNGLRINGTLAANELRYDRSWWSAANLTLLENKVSPPPPPQQGRRVRTGPQPTYATPTESFAYKVVDTNKFARSISGTMREMPMPARPPTPPAPEVDWVVATHELSKLLIPTDRQTRSCTTEELGGVRTKKDRQSVPPVLAASIEEVGRPRQLRDRKAKVPARYAESAHSDELESVRSVSRASSSSRRQTLHAFPVPTAADGAAEQALMLQRRASRRLSAGSVLSSVDGIVEGEVPTMPFMPTLPPTENGHSAMKPPPAPLPHGGMQVKKTRAPPTSKAHRPVLPQTLSTPVAPTIPTNTATTTPPLRVALNGTLAPQPAPAGSSNDFNTLTSGMKRITLKVGTREEHDRKQMEKEAAAAQAGAAERRARALKGAETRRVNAAAKKAAQQTATVQHARNGVSPPANAVPLTETIVATAGTSEQQQPQQMTNMATLTSSETFDDQQAVSSDADPIQDVTAAAGAQLAQSSTPGPTDATPATEPTTATADISEAERFLTDESMPGDNSDNTTSVITGTSSVSVLATEPTFEQTTLPSQLEVEDERPATPSSDPVTDSVTTRKATPPSVLDSAARQLLQKNDMAIGVPPPRRPNYSSSPSMSSPSSKKLPVWNSTGPIPFAPASAASPKSRGKPARSPPKTPLRRAPTGMRDSVDDGNGVSRSMLGGLEDEVVKKPTSRVIRQKDQGGIWEVPETPER